MSTPSGQKQGLDQNTRYIAGWLFFSAAFGLVVSAFMAGSQWGVAILWSLGCIASGLLVGFLFALPRTTEGTEVKPASGSGGAGEAQLARRLRVNTNLEQISDWVTKIIVG